MGKTTSRPIVDYPTAVKRLGCEEAARIEEGFDRLGVRGVLRRSEFRTGFLNAVVGAPVPEDLAEALFNGFDTGATGKVTVHEFVCGLAVLRHGTPEEKLKLLFAIYDADRDQRLSDRDLKRFAQALADSRGATRERAIHDALQALSAAGQTVNFKRFSEWANEHIDSPLVTWLYDIERRLAEELVEPGGKCLRAVNTASTGGASSSSGTRPSRTASICRNDEEEVCSWAAEFDIEDREFVAELRAAWKALVAESQFGVLDAATFKKAALPSAPAELQGRIFRALNRSRSGAVSLAEWVQGVGTWIVGTPKAMRDFGFRLFAEDDGSVISFQEAQVLHRLASAVGTVFAELSSSVYGAARSAASHCRPRSHGRIEEGSPIVQLDRPRRAVPPDGLLREALESEPWASEAESIVRALGRLARVDQRLPPRQRNEEREIVCCLNAPFDPEAPGRPGDVWCLISARWYEKWSDVVASPDAKSPELPSIDNSSLVDSVGSLRVRLCERADYRVITQGAWNALHAWYGSPGPPLVRTVIEIDGQRELEMYPLRLHVNRTDKDGNELLLERKLEVSRALPLRDVKEKACALHGISESVSVSHRSSPHQDWVDDDEESTLHALGFIDGHHILLRLEGTAVSPSRSARVKETSDDRFHGVTGLQNLGNTCYMNSSLQCLMCTPFLAEYFTKEYLYDLNCASASGSGGKLAVAFSELALAMLGSKGKSSIVIAPRTFVRVFTDVVQDFAGWAQQDAHEFLSVFLSGLSDDVNRAVDEPRREHKDVEGRTDHDTARERWAAHCRMERSVIAALFTGQLKSSLRCGRCGCESSAFDPFMSLQVPLPEQSFRWVTCTVVSTPRAGLVEHTVRLCARVPKRGRVADLIRSAADIAGLAGSELIAAEVVDGYVFRILKSSILISALREDCRPVVFHIASPARAGQAPRAKCLSEHAMDVPNGDAFVPRPRAPSAPGGIETNGMRIPLAAAAGESKSSPQGRGLEDSLVVHFVHRRLQRVTEYFLNPFKPELFGMPILARIPGDCLPHELYNTVWRHVKHLVPHLDAKEGSWPFVLCTVKRDGSSCSTCSWRRGCLGCVVPVGEDGLPDSASRIDFSLTKSFSIDWDADALEHHFKEKIAAHVHVDASVETAQRERTKPEELTECLDELMKEEPIDARPCSACSKKAGRSMETPHVKQLRLWGLPPVLILQLNRFHCRRGASWKIQTKVDFPARFDLGKYLAPGGALEACPDGEMGLQSLSRGWSEYDLYAIVNHIGGMGSGHYTSYVKSKGRWLSCNDERVIPISEEDLVTAHAYLLFYVRRDVSTARVSLSDLFPQRSHDRPPADPEAVRQNRIHRAASQIAGLRSMSWERAVSAPAISATMGSTSAVGGAGCARSPSDLASEATSDTMSEVSACSMGVSVSNQQQRQRLECNNGHLILKRKKKVRWHQHWLKATYCSMCQEKIPRDRVRWRCRFHCDFDVCGECYAKHRREARAQWTKRKPNKVVGGDEL